MHTGTERLHTAAMALASSVSWHGCAVAIQCGNAVFTLDSQAAAHRDCIQDE